MLNVAVLAAACIRNLRQTFKYGGRQTLPSKVEVLAASVSTNHELTSPGRAVGPVCVCARACMRACVRDRIILLHEIFWPRSYVYLACWFVFTLSRSDLKFKVIGQKFITGGKFC